jgi:hypothetical protein
MLAFREESFKAFRHPSCCWDTSKAVHGMTQRHTDAGALMALGSRAQVAAVGGQAGR